MAINLSAPFFLAQTAASRMTEGGAIVNITSIDAYGADGPFSSYVAAKAGPPRADQGGRRRARPAWDPRQCREPRLDAHRHGG